MVDGLAERQRGGESLLDKVEIINEREGGLVEAMVPIDLINREEVAVNEFHVNELVDSMLTESEKGVANGQLTPILLGHIEGRRKFSIIDGFHRDSALFRSEKQSVFATIRLNTTEDEVDDLRILTASSHSSVAFSRIVEWVGTAWERTEWAKTITAAQAFSLANSKAMTGARMGLTEEAAVAIREWALDKCTRWRIAPGTIYQSMATAQVADPTLVSSARQRESGHRLDELTPDHLKYISRAYPNKFYEQQNVASIVTKNNFTIAETKIVLDILGDIDHDSSVTEIIELTDWIALLEKDPIVIRKRKPVVETKEIELTQRPTPIKKRASPKNIKVVEAETGEHVQSSEFMRVVNTLTSTQVELARVVLKNNVLSGTYTPARSSDTLASPFIAKHLPDDISEMLLSDVTGIPDLLQLLSDEVKKPLVRSVMVLNDIDEDTADYIVSEAFHRVQRDATDGILRFAFPKKKEHTLTLLKRAVSDEVVQLNEIHQNAPATVKQEVVRFEDIALTMPTLHPMGRIGIALFGTMNAPRSSVQQVLRLTDIDAEKFEKSLIDRLSL